MRRHGRTGRGLAEEVAWDPRGSRPVRGGRRPVEGSGQGGARGGGGRTGEEAERGLGCGGGEWRERTPPRASRRAPGGALRDPPAAAAPGGAPLPFCPQTRGSQIGGKTVGVGPGRGGRAGWAGSPEDLGAHRRCSQPRAVRGAGPELALRRGWFFVSGCSAPDISPGGVPFVWPFLEHPPGLCLVNV